jgi:TolA-binding protein
MLETEDELRDIKREIIESRALVIRTNNLTNALSADIKSIAKRQQEYERKLAWNGATAYVLFVVVLFGALKVAWDARVDQIRSETEQRASENDRLKRELRDAQKRDEERTRAEAHATVFYELVRQNKRAEMVEAWESLRHEPLSRTEAAVLGDAVERARNDLAGGAYQQGMDRLRLQRWQEAATSFEDALRLKDDSVIAANAKLGLGTSYRKLGRQRDAIPLLEQVAEGAADRELQDDALYEIANCQMELQAWNDAKTTWRALIRRFPDSRLTPEAKMVLAQISLVH